ncbi:MAG: AraC family transcriptional regulator [Bacteroidota bacterium]
MKIYINNMVSVRHKIIVSNILTELGLSYSSVEMGEAEINEPVPEIGHERLKAALLQIGLEIMDTRQRILVQKIKNIIVASIYHSTQPMTTNLSEYLSSHSNYDYTYLSNVFSEVEGTTIEQFTIIQKINRVKDLLLYDELTLTDISVKMHYRSLSHLSKQFKKITGLTVSHFKKLKTRNSPGV